MNTEKPRRASSSAEIPREGYSKQCFSETGLFSSEKRPNCRSATAPGDATRGLLSRRRRFLLSDVFQVTMRDLDSHHASDIVSFYIVPVPQPYASSPNDAFVVAASCKYDSEGQAARYPERRSTPESSLRIYAEGVCRYRASAGI